MNIETCKGNSHYDAISYRGDYVYFDTLATYYSEQMRNDIEELMEFGVHIDDIRRAIEVWKSGKELMDVNYKAKSLDTGEIISWEW